jgi:hypothetical protein
MLYSCLESYFPKKQESNKGMRSLYIRKEQPENAEPESEQGRS